MSQLHYHHQAQNSQFAVKHGHKQNFLKNAKVPNMRNFTKFLAYREGKMVILTYSVNFSCRACRYISQWLLKIFSDGNCFCHLWRVTLPHLKGGTPNCFSLEWPQRMYLRLPRWHWSLWGVREKFLRGLLRRGLNYKIKHNYFTGNVKLMLT